MSKDLGVTGASSQLTNAGQKEAFRALQSTSKNASEVDTAAINQIGSLTSEYIGAARDAAAKATTEEDVARRLGEAREALKGAREDILEVNRRSHESQRGFATLAIKGALLLAGAAVTGGLWLLSKK